MKTYVRQYRAAAKYMADKQCRYADQAIRYTAPSGDAEPAIDRMWEYIDIGAPESVGDLTPEEKVLWLLFLACAEASR